MNVFQTLFVCFLAWCLVAGVWFACRSPEADTRTVTLPGLTDQQFEAILHAPHEPGERPVVISWAEKTAPRLHNSVTINACYKIRNGQLRLAAVSADGRLFCRRNELPIQWPATCECGP